MAVASPTPVSALARYLAEGSLTSSALVEAAFERIDDPARDGAASFIRLFRSSALACAQAYDLMRDEGTTPSPLAGIPVSVKDLCDIGGLTTLAGSAARRDEAPAARDATAVARLRAAGAVIVGTTNMTELAFGGLGLNPHFGNPRNPHGREIGLIPGGSSSGAAVSVADGMAAAALGTDTAGSVRIPAALCGLAGFKPTARRVPLDGVLPLAPSLDSVGVLAPTVSCCALVDSVFAGEPWRPLKERPLRGLRFAAPKTLVLDDLDPAVAKAFSDALGQISAAGARIEEIELPQFREMAAINARGGFTPVEGFAVHRRLLDRAVQLLDPVIAARLRRGGEMSAADYIEMLDVRRHLVRELAPITADYAALLMPTVPIAAVPIAGLQENADRWLGTNALLIRNTIMANLFDRCALTLPCHEPETLPVGLMLVGETMADRRLLEVGAAVERVLPNGPE